MSPGRKRKAPKAAGSFQPLKKPPESDEGESEQVTGCQPFKVLLNELVLEKVTKNLGAGDLKTLRRTSTQWNRHFAPALSTKHSQIALECVDVRGGQSSPMATFMEEISNRSSPPPGHPGLPCPFSTYNLQEFGFNVDRDLEFFELCGPTMRKLGLGSSFQWRQDPGFVNTRQILFELTPELEELILCFYNTPENQWVQNTRRRRRRGRAPPLKNPLPKLKELQILKADSGHPQYDEFIADLLECAVGLEMLLVVEGDNIFNLQILAAIRDRAPHLDKIKSFTLFGLDVEHFRLLAELGSRTNTAAFQLKEFCVSIGFPNEEEAQDVEAVELLHSFLETQAPTLQILLIDLVWNSEAEKPKTAIRIPRMPHVRNLQWGRGEEKQFNLEFQGGSMERCFPGLKRFCCIYEEWSTDLYGVGEELRAMAHTGIQELELYVSHRVARPTAQALGSLWPAVTKLEAELKGEHIDLFAAEAWPRLEVLHIRIDKRLAGHGRLMLDEFLSGIPISEHSSLESKTAKLCGPHSRKLGALRALLPKHKTEPGLSDFTHLKKFVFDSKECPVLVNNIGGFFGLAMGPPTIQQVTIRGPWTWRGAPGVKEMETACKEVIRTKFGKNSILDVSELKN